MPASILGVPEDRFPIPVEAAAYFVVAEGLTNVARHAQSASRVDVEVTEADGALTVEVSDDGGRRGDARGQRACAGSPTGSRRSAASSRSPARPAAARD